MAAHPGVRTEVNKGGMAIHAPLATMRFPADFGVSENYEGATERMEVGLPELLPKSKPLGS